MSLLSHPISLKSIVNVALPYAPSSPSGLLHPGFWVKFCVHFSFPYMLHVVLIPSSSLQWPNNVQWRVETDIKNLVVMWSSPGIWLEMSALFSDTSFCCLSIPWKVKFHCIKQHILVVIFLALHGKVTVSEVHLLNVTWSSFHHE